MSDASSEVPIADAALPEVPEDGSGWPEFVEELLGLPFQDEQHCLDESRAVSPDFHFAVLRGGSEEDDFAAAELEAEQELLALILDERWGPRAPVHEDPRQDAVTPRVAEVLDVPRAGLDAWVHADRVVLLGVQGAPFELCVAVVKRSGHVEAPVNESLWPEFVGELAERGLPEGVEHQFTCLRPGLSFEELAAQRRGSGQRREFARWQDDLAEELERLWGPRLAAADGRVAELLARFPAFGEVAAEIDVWPRVGRLLALGVVADEHSPENLFVLVTIPASCRA